MVTHQPQKTFSRRTAIAYSLALIGLGINFYLLTLPGNSLPTVSWFDQIQADKLVHIALFGLLVASWYWPMYLHKGWKALRGYALLVAVAALAYGIAMEFVQKHFIPNRAFDLWDIVADAVGCAVAYLYVQRRVKNQTPPTP